MTSGILAMAGKYNVCRTAKQWRDIAHHLSKQGFKMQAQFIHDTVADAREHEFFAFPGLDDANRTVFDLSAKALGH